MPRVLRVFEAEPMIYLRVLGRDNLTTGARQTLRGSEGQRGAKTAKGAVSSASKKGSYSQTATSHVNSGDVAVSSLSGDPALGAVNTVPLLAPPRDTDEKALLAKSLSIYIVWRPSGSSYKPYKSRANARPGNRKCRQGFNV